MKIKQSDSGSSSSRFFRDFFRKRKYLVGGIIGAGSLAALAGLFLAVVGYGAYVGKLGQYAYAKPTLLKISELDFSFLKSYAKGGPALFDEVEVDINMKNLARIQSLREQAMEEGLISDAIRKEEVPAKLSYRGTAYEVKISLAGQMALHLKNPVKWPFHVKVAGGITMDGMKQFDLSPASTGEYMTDWLGNELLKDRGLKGVKGDFVKLAINGKPAGFFYLQERFSRKLVENKRFGTGILFHIEEGLAVYEEKMLMEDPDAKEQLLLLKRRWEELQAGKLPLEQFFDLEKMGKLFALADLMNQQRPLLRENLAFYFNPKNKLAEPVALEFNGLSNSGRPAFTSALEKPGPESKWHAALAQDPVFKMICGKPGFKSAYLREAEVLCHEDFIDELLMRNGEQLNVLLNKAYSKWPANELPTQMLHSNQRNLRFVLFPDEGEITAYFNRAEAGRLDVSLLNQQDLPLEIAYLSWRDTFLFYPESPLVLDPGMDGDEQPHAFHFKFPQGLIWSDTLLPELKVYYNLPGLWAGKRNALVFPWPYPERLNRNGNPIARAANYASFGFIEEDAETNAIVIPKGDWALNRDLVIPAGKRFEVEAGARVDMRGGAKVICYSPVFFNGTAEEPILIHSSDTTAQGLVVIGASEERSSIAHTTFAYLSCSKEPGWGVSGAVVLYESPVDFSNVSFVGNREGDDFLNVIRADFTMDQTLFKDINADAFDCDFCTGAVTNSSFVNVGNDGIDVSGTTISISHVTMNGIGDKGLSAGEGSDMTAQHIEISKAEIALTSKDRSRLAISDAKVLNSRIGVAIFVKKTEYGPAFVRADRVEIKDAEIPYAIEKNSGFVLDGASFPPNRDDVKKILYGAEFGKASR